MPSEWVVQVTLQPWALMIRALLAGTASAVVAHRLTPCSSHAHP